MKKIVRLQESDITELVKKILSEQENERYMFFSNLEQLHRQTAILLDLGEDAVVNILEQGHDWAQDHVAVAKENIDQVFDFMMNQINDDHITDDSMGDVVQIEEGKKKTGTKLCVRGKSAAKSKFDVYPSAYANGYAVQVCKGTQEDFLGHTYPDETYINKKFKKDEVNSLQRWYNEEWVNVCEKGDGPGGYKVCGTGKGIDDPQNYPYCRAYYKLPGTTVTTAQELTKEEINSTCSNVKS